MMDEGTTSNGAFSKLHLRVQLAVDSTSLGEFKTCPRKYFYRMIEGWVPRGQQVDLEFGILMHQGAERYEIGRSRGEGHEDALRDALRWLMLETWDPQMKRGKLFDHAAKTRLGLVRSLVWYCDLIQNDSARTLRLASGRPAVELTFSFDSGYRTKDGEPILLCGYIDRMAEFGGLPRVVDIKTTGHTINKDWFKQFSPHNQFTLYILASKVALGVEAKGLIVDGMQVAVSFTRFMRDLVDRSDEYLDEWYKELGWWLARMEECARADLWPQNDTACGMYGGCRYREVCSRSPSARQGWLERNFVKSVWDPTKVRGDF